MDFKVFHNKKKNSFMFGFGNTRLSNVLHIYILSICTLSSESLEQKIYMLLFSK